MHTQLGYAGILFVTGGVAGLANSRTTAVLFLGLNLAACTSSREPAASSSGGRAANDASAGSGGLGGNGGTAGGALGGFGGKASGGSSGSMQDGGADAASSLVYPGGKKHYSLVYGNLDAQGTTWVRHANYTFSKDGSVAATLWQWDSQGKKGKAPYTQHRCTMNGVTKDCFTYTPTGWIYPEKQHFDWTGSFQLLEKGVRLRIDWKGGEKESWDVVSTSTPTLRGLSFKDSSFAITHGQGYGSNAGWKIFRSLQQIVKDGGLKKWTGRVAAASSNGSTISVRDWGPTLIDLSSFTSSSWSSKGYTLHAMLPHSSKVCTGGCTGPYSGKIMYHLASTETGRAMAYNNWCTCLSLAKEWPCYNRNMHPLALNSVIDDSGRHRGWLYVEQQNQVGYSGYQYQIGYVNDL